MVVTIPMYHRPRRSFSSLPRFDTSPSTSESTSGCLEVLVLEQARVVDVGR